MILNRFMDSTVGSIHFRRRARALALTALFCFGLGFVDVAAAQGRAQQQDEEEYESLWRRGEYRRALEKLDAEIERVSGSSGRVPAMWMVHRSQLNFEIGEVDAAIEDMRGVDLQLREPTYAIQLALLYRYRGRLDDYYKSLERATELAERAFGFGAYNENIIALGRLLELVGENPRTILTTTYDSFLREGSRYVPGLIAAADLAYRKSDYALAAGYYERALAIEEDNLNALAGLAECYWKSSDERLKETVDKILAVNPRHARAKAIEVELLLDKGMAAEARPIVLNQLGINPNSTRFRSLFCASLFLTDETEHMERIAREALEFNPVASEVFRTVGRIASRHYRFKEAAELQRRALELNEEDHEARAAYAFDLLRLGQDIEGRAQLERAFNADPYNVQAYNTLQLLDKVQTFSTIERGPFRLQLPARDSAALGADALDLLDEAIALYEEKYRIDLEKPVYVQLFDNHDDFMVRSVGLAGAVGYMGICFGRLVTMDAPSARPKRSMNWHSVLWHEFVHVVTLQKTGNRMPRWLSEGISVFEETERDPAWGQRLDPQFKAILDEGELPGLSELESYFTQARSAVHLMFGYFSAGEFVGHYVETYGFDALRDSLDAISAGKKAEVALAEAAGATLDEIDKGFREFLTERLAPLENLPAIRADAALEVDVMDDDTSQTLTERGWGASQSVFTDRMKAAEEARAEERWEDLERELRAAHEAFPDYMAADAPLRQLIRLHERRGERDKLKEALAEEIAWNPTDYDARARLAALLREDEQWERLRAVSLGALGIDPYEVGMRRTLIDARLKTGDDAGALSALDQLVRLDIARATDYRLQRLDILIRVEDWSRARQEAVQLLEDVPHYWEAQQRLLRIVDRDGVKEGRGADRHR